MTSHRFDELARTSAQGSVSRRSVLGATVVALATAVLKPLPANAALSKVIRSPQRTACREYEFNTQAARLTSSACSSADELLAKQAALGVVGLPDYELLASAVGALGFTPAERPRASIGRADGAWVQTVLVSNFRMAGSRNQGATVLYFRNSEGGQTAIALAKTDTAAFGLYVDQATHTVKTFRKRRLSDPSGAPPVPLSGSSDPSMIAASSPEASSINGKCETCKDICEIGGKFLAWGAITTFCAGAEIPCVSDILAEAFGLEGGLALVGSTEIDVIQEISEDAVVEVDSKKSQSDCEKYCEARYCFCNCPSSLACCDGKCTLLIDNDSHCAICTQDCTMLGQICCYKTCCNAESCCGEQCCTPDTGMTCSDIHGVKTCTCDGDECTNGQVCCDNNCATPCPDQTCPCPDKVCAGGLCCEHGGSGCPSGKMCCNHTCMSDSVCGGNCPCSDGSCPPCGGGCAQGCGPITCTTPGAYCSVGDLFIGICDSNCCCQG